MLRGVPEDAVKETIVVPHRTEISNQLPKKIS